MRRLVLGLNAATVALVATGILLLVLPTRVPDGRAVSGLVTSTGVLPDSVWRMPAADLDAGDRVVRTNIFSPRRSAPPQRHVFGETTPEPDDVAADLTTSPALGGEAVDSMTASTAADAVPRLYGTMLGAAEASALLRLDARVSEPRLYRIGDTAGGYRVVEIADRSVTLIGRNGRVVLRLARPTQ